jgi:hypothetical protein
MCATGDQERRPAVLQHEGHASGRKRGIQWQIGRTGLHDSDQAREEGRVTVPSESPRLHPARAPRCAIRWATWLARRFSSAYVSCRPLHSTAIAPAFAALLFTRAAAAPIRRGLGRRRTAPFSQDLVAVRRPRAAASETADSGLLEERVEQRPIVRQPSLHGRGSKDPYRTRGRHARETVGSIERLRSETARRPDRSRTVSTKGS